MIKNYFKIAWRNLTRNRLYATLNIAGLSLGLSCALIVFWFIRFQTTHDHYHKNIDQIYQVTTEFRSDGIGYSRGVPVPMWKALRTEFPQATTAISIERNNPFIGVLNSEGKLLKKFEEEGPLLTYVQPEYFDIFDFPWKVGSPKSLTKPNTVVISEKLAYKYFGNENPLGKQLKLYNKLDLEVTGIMGALPENTDMPYEIFVSFETLTANPDFGYGGSGLDNWGGVNSNTYVFMKIPEGMSISGIEKKMDEISKKYHGNGANTWGHPVVAFKDIHHSERYYGGMPMKWIWVMAAIGIFIIVTACFNFINMATAQALKRSREVGVRKAVGGTKGQVFSQFMLETAIVTFVSIASGFVIAVLLLPNISEWLDQPGTWPKAVTWNDPVLWSFLVTLFGVVVILAGSYPGSILSGFRPVLALKGNIGTRQVGGISLRRALIVFQFALIQLLVICTLVVNQQVNYMLTKSVGYETKGIVSVPVPGADKINQKTFRQRLMQIPGIENVTMCQFAPTSSSNNTSNPIFENREKEELWQVNTKPGDHHYIEAYGLELVAGKNIPESDTILGYLVNEKVVERLGFKNPKEVIGKNFKVWGVQAPIYGVLKNWNNTSFQNAVDPVAIFTYNNANNIAGIKLKTQNVHATMKSVEKLWNEYFPDNLYKQNFLDEKVRESYKMEEIMLNLIRVFSFIAIFIGCLGLFGLVKFMASQKTKEIGVRKVLGASISSVLGIFGKEIGLLIGVAFLIAAPLGWYLMHIWLQSYLYKIDIGVGIYVGAVLITLVVAAVTASYESIKAALLDPVKSLRSE